ncbi:beta-1,4-N-acetylgalactosaminyltransferase bre-4-like [Ischnura elegans]|uniref:beta-1,4-N-acetylgalactosaminyltransferase bre-4-like n=1 Tax=Ischnura elegans TaxID=197161 RepID=UPI001ED8AD61|nr:beta-1,4-N-acetylgalactosaminyltransferase bre-4-like [Ischnura elegans]XP_046405911.1 beta-1,4-N-acetylgalactosaminyltransferase bre-4-like [Ischnura elegans]
MILQIFFAIFHRRYIHKILLGIATFFLFSYLLHPGRFSSTDYDYIEIDNMKNFLSPSPLHISGKHMNKTQLCPIIIDKDKDIMSYPRKTVSESEKLAMPTDLNILPGGVWKPSSCMSNFQVAIVIPYRDRERQLDIFLSYMHPFLQAQMIEYRIVVVEQTSLHPFNRAKLMNIGFAETVKIFPYHCFIFHDVDLIPQNPNNIYACTHQPRHMSSSLNTFRYNLPYKDLFGGAVAILKRQFEEINGFSNAFFGWGGEDDDFKNRISYKGLQVYRFSPDVSKYVMLAHKKELPSESRFLNLKSGRERYETDGLNNLQYDLLKLENRSLYTWMLVNILPSDTNTDI